MTFITPPCFAPETVQSGKVREVLFTTIMRQRNAAHTSGGLTFR